LCGHAFSASSISVNKRLDESLDAFARHRQILAVEMANRESRSSWKAFREVRSRVEFRLVEG
jgi:transposase-like protein